MSFVGEKSLGVDLSLVGTTAKHDLGSRVESNDGGVFIYVKAGGAITANDPVKMATGYVATASGNAGTVFGISPVTLANNEYGWIQIKGKCSAAADSGCTAGDALSVIANASGQVVKASAVNEGGAGTYVSGALGVRGFALTDDATNVATIYLL